MQLRAFCCAHTKYAWILPDFARLAAANFPFPVDIYVGDSPWNVRMREILSSYDCRDVIYLQEDFLITSVNMGLVEQCYHFHKKKKAIITKLGSNYEFLGGTFVDTIDYHPVYKQNPSDEYLMSHQPVAIFNREFLMQSITDKTPDASSHEINGSKWMRKNNLTRVYCVGWNYRPVNKSDIFTFQHAIRKGKLLREADKLLTNIPENISWDG